MQSMANLFDQIKGHEKQIESLLEAIRNDRFPSNFIFFGTDGIGKRLVARALAQTLVCENSKFLACGRCGSCIRVDHGGSESLLEIFPEKNSIRIEKSKEIISYLSLQKISRARIIIIDGAHSLNPQAANALLKTFEEPPESVYFFLITSNIDQMLTTVKSRAQHLGFHPLSEQELASIENGPEWMLKASRGSVSSLKSWMDDDVKKNRQEAAELMRNFIVDQDFLISGKWRDQLRDRETAIQTSRNWVSLIRDAHMQYQERTDLIINLDMKECLSSLAALKPSVLNRLSKEIIKIEAGLKAHRDVILVIEEFWLKAQVF
jgi:DNA polymerase-3 subunit delta'